MKSLGSHRGRVVLTLNGGSSSLKFSVVDAATPDRKLLGGSVSGIAGSSPTLTLRSEGGQSESRPVHAPEHAGAADVVLAELGPYAEPESLAAIAHRVVHGGQQSAHPRRVTPALIAQLRALAALDPDHLPAEISLIEAMGQRAPQVPAVCCFDTTFHRDLPRVARLLAIPKEYAARGLTRYGFHGLSYTSLLEALARDAGQVAARGRVILAHLGAGASLCAVREGKCVETTMGFTPTSGVPMATRSGDLDPGVLIWLLRQGGMSVDALDDLLNHRSGLLGLSGSSGDMRELLAREATDGAAADAIALFCYQVKKAIGALATTIAGLDTLVFSGGIGEHSPEIRARATRGLEHLGIVIDERLNQAHAPIISANSSACTVRVIATDEESILVRAALATLQPSHDFSQEASQ